MIILINLDYALCASCHRKKLHGDLSALHDEEMKMISYVLPNGVMRLVFAVASRDWLEWWLTP